MACITVSWLLPQSKMNVPEAAPAAPQRTDADISEAAAEQRRRLYQEAPGRRATLGGGLDVMGLYSTSAAKLLGGS